MVVLKFLIHKTSIDQKLLQLRVCLQNKQKERSFEEISPTLSELIERFGLFFEGDEIVIPEELKKQVVEALHFGHPGSMKWLAKNNML